MNEVVSAETRQTVMPFIRAATSNSDIENTSGRKMLPKELSFLNAALPNEKNKWNTEGKATALDIKCSIIREYLIDKNPKKKLIDIAIMPSIHLRDWIVLFQEFPINLKNSVGIEYDESHFFQIQRTMRRLDKTLPSFAQLSVIYKEMGNHLVTSKKKYDYIDMDYCDCPSHDFIVGVKSIQKDNLNPGGVFSSTINICNKARANPRKNFKMSIAEYLTDRSFRKVSDVRYKGSRNIDMLQEIFVKDK